MLGLKLNHVSTRGPCYVCFGIIYGCFVLRRIHYKRTNNNIRKSFIIITLLLRVSYDCPGNHNKVKKRANLVRNIWDQRHWIKLLHAKVHTVLIVKIWETGTRQRWLAFWLHTCCYTLWKVLNFYFGTYWHTKLLQNNSHTCRPAFPVLVGWGFVSGSPESLHLDNPK